MYMSTLLRNQIISPGPVLLPQYLSKRINHCNNSLTNDSTPAPVHRIDPFSLTHTSLCEFVMYISRKKNLCHGHSRLHNFYLSVILTPYPPPTSPSLYPIISNFNFSAINHSIGPPSAQYQRIFSSLGNSPLLLDLGPPGR